MGRFPMWWPYCRI